MYQYDGASIEPVPFNADTLLSSSYRLNDHTTIVGGRDTETYGIDPTLGKVKYACDVSGCSSTENEENSSDVTLVVSRTSRTVRAVDMMSGAER